MQKERDSNFYPVVQVRRKTHNGEKKIKMQKCNQGGEKKGSGVRA